MAKLVCHEEGMVAWKAPLDSCNWRTYRNWQLCINQGWRRATLLAYINATYLFEYEMPNGKIYLHEIGLTRDGRFASIGKSINKKRLPRKWELAEHFLNLCDWGI